MAGKIVVIISTSDIEKARTGAMYAKNALLNGWMDEVKIFFFGPAQKLLLEDKELQNFVEEISALGETPIACKFISERDNNSEDLAKVGAQVEYVGSPISKYINDGYIPMVWWKELVFNKYAFFTKLSFRTRSFGEKSCSFVGDFSHPFEMTSKKKIHF